ncbi:MAG: sigma 54-interacting transcriptional regulator [Syntrophorhabdales bacterium]
MDVGIYVLDRNLSIQWLNTRASRWLRKEEFSPESEKRCYEEIPKKDHPCENCPVLRTFASGKTQRLELTVEAKGGETLYYLLTATPLMREPGADFSYVVETVQNITDQKKAAMELARLNDFNAAIIENAPIAIFTIDGKGTFTSVNPALATLSGLGSEAEKRLIGFNWLKNRYTRESGLAAHIERGLKGEPFQLQDFPFTTYRGDRPHFIDFNGVPLKGKDGQTEGLLCIVKETTDRVNEKRLLKERTMLLEEHLHRVDTRDSFIGESRAIGEVRTLISTVAASNTPVLILGETGTGKELVARAIHRLSARSANPFVVINSSALQEGMVESELFGHRKGAFTSASSDKIGLLKIADKGTFFMDEVGDLPSGIQAKLLRVLETGAFRRLGDTQETKVDVRFIFATNKQLEKEVDEKRFRKDLFYRLNGFTIVVPPLTERKKDIPLLVDYFLTKLARGAGRKRVPREVMDLLMDYPWPGNVRELANILERVVLISADRDEIRVGDFPPGITRGRHKDEVVSLPGPGGIGLLSKMQKDYVQQILDSVGGNKSKAARLLGISRRKLYRSIGEA